MDALVDAVLVIDVANVVGSRPDGWWRDRAGAASRLLQSLVPLRDARVPRPDGRGDVDISAVLAVLEGAARSAVAPQGIDTVLAVQDGDSEIVTQAGRVLAAARIPIVVTADRGLRARLPSGCVTAGPQWLNRLIDR